MFYEHFKSIFNFRMHADIGIWGLDVERIKVGKKYYSPYGDALSHIESSSGLKFLCFDTTINFFRKTHLPQDGITLPYKIAPKIAEFLSFFYRNKTCNIPLSSAVAWCRKRNLPLTGLRKNFILRETLKICFLKNYYKWIIRRRKLKVCFVVCWYSDYGMALACAARELSIPCYDLQHGIAGESEAVFILIGNEHQSMVMNSYPLAFGVGAKKMLAQFLIGAVRMLNPSRLLWGVLYGKDYGKRTNCR